MRRLYKKCLTILKDWESRYEESHGSDAKVIIAISALLIVIYNIRNRLSRLKNFIVTEFKKEFGLYPLPKIGKVLRLRKETRDYIQNRVENLRNKRWVRWVKYVNTVSGKIRRGNPLNPESSIEEALIQFLSEDVLYIKSYGFDVYGTIKFVNLKGKHREYELSIASDFAFAFETLGDDIETYRILYNDGTIDELFEHTEKVKL